MLELWVQRESGISLVMDRESPLCERAAFVRGAQSRYSRLICRTFPPFSGTHKFVQGETQLEIGLLAIWESQDQQAIYLHTLDERHLVPITTGIFEATALDRILKGYPSPRPLTHDTFAASIRLLGGEVQDVVIQRLEDRIYYVNARIRAQGNLLLLDLQPSDALVLAVLFDCPIVVADEVLSQTDRQGNIK